jgi:hypothetical protein
VAKDAEVFGITTKRKVGSCVALVGGDERDGEILLAIIGALLLRSSGAQIKLEDDVPSHGRINVELVDKTLGVVDLEDRVLRIHDILVWIQIRIRGSMPLKMDPDLSGYGSGSSYFLSKFSAYYFLRHIYIIYQR